MKKILRSEKIIFKDQKFCCKDCVLGKVHRLPFPKSERIGKIMQILYVQQENSLGEVLNDEI